MLAGIEAALIELFILQTSVLREPAVFSFVEQFEDPTLDSVHLSRIHLSEMDYEVKVVPHVMVVILVLVKACTCHSLQVSSVQSTDEAFIVSQPKLVIRSCTQGCESVDNDTKHHVQENSDDDQEEGQVVSEPDVEGISVFWDESLGRQEFPDTSTHSDTVIQRGQEAVHQGHTDGSSFFVQQTSMKSIVIVVVSDELESYSSVNIEENYAEQACHEQLVVVFSHRLNNALQLWEPVNRVQ